MLKNGKIIKIKETYLLLLLIGLVVRAINFMSLLPSKYDGVVFTFLAVFGGLLLFYDFVDNVLKRRFPYDIFLVLFVIILLITSSINRQYGIVPNLKLIIWSSIYYFLAYQFGKECYGNSAFFNKFNLTLIYTWFLLSFVSLAMFFFNFGYEKFYSPRDRIRIGFLESRLFGVFGDPNYGATTSVVVIILCVCYLVKSNNKLFKIFLASNIFFQYLYIVLSGSRTAEVVAYVSIAITISVLIFNLDYFRSKSKTLKVTLSVASIFLSILILYTLIDGTKLFFSQILETIKSWSSNINAGLKSQANTSLVRRDVVESSDVSNMRFSIWKSALEIFSTSWLIGVSPKNLLPYAKEHLPNGFIAQHGFIAHNSYINVLTSTGVLGAMSFFSFCIKDFIQVIKKIEWFNLNKNNFRFFYFLVVLSYSVFGLFNSEFVLEHTVGSLVFWLFLGRLMGGGENID
ncbi:O-antigen ligase family protein [Enterococcus sp. AZ109]|uniref:O-antigen ligase family protein n=1 Tax=Enterococcus sp. AZ109 TaxID=2774634 RepID=UPI003F1F49D5